MKLFKNKRNELINCSFLKRINKDDFDQYLGDEQFYTESDKIKFQCALVNKKTKKPLIPQLVTVAIIIAVFIILIQGTMNPMNTDPVNVSPAKEQNNANSVNEYIHDDLVKQLNEVESEEALLRYLYSHVPGLQRAERLGFVNEVNKKIDIKNSHSDLRIDKIWYKSNSIVMIHSFKVSDATKYLKHSIDLYLNNQYKSSVISREEPGVVYEGRLYKILEIQPIKHEDDSVKQEVNGLYKFDIIVQISGDKFTLNDQEIPLSFSKKKEDQYTLQVPIDQEIKKGGLALSFDSLESRLDKNVIGISYLTDENHILNRIEYKKDDGSQEVLSFDGFRNPTSNQLKESIEPFNRVPTSLELDIQKAELISDESLSFKIDTTQFESDSWKKIEMNRLIGEKFNTKVYLTKINYYKGELSVALKYVVLDEGKHLSFREVSYERPDFRDPNSISLSNEKGETYQFNYLVSGGVEDGFMFRIPEEFLERSKEITVDISNLLYEIQIDKKLEIPIKE